MDGYINENTRRREYIEKLKREMESTNYKIQVEEEKVDAMNYKIQELENDKELRSRQISEIQSVKGQLVGRYKPYYNTYKKLKNDPIWFRINTEKKAQTQIHKQTANLIKDKTEMAEDLKIGNTKDMTKSVLTRMKLDLRKTFKDTLQVNNVEFDKKQEDEFSEKMKFGESIGRIFRGMKPLLVYLDSRLKEFLNNKAIKLQMGVGMDHINDNNGEMIFENSSLRDVYRKSSQDPGDGSILTAPANQRLGGVSTSRNPAGNQRRGSRNSQRKIHQDQSSSKSSIRKDSAQLIQSLNKFGGVSQSPSKKQNGISQRQDMIARKAAVINSPIIIEQSIRKLSSKNSAHSKSVEHENLSFVEGSHGDEIPNNSSVLVEDRKARKKSIFEAEGQLICNSPICEKEEFSPDFSSVRKGERYEPRSQGKIVIDEDAGRKA